MSTSVLAPTLVFKSWRNDGTPNAGGTLASYLAGSNTPTATYTDNTGTTPNANPATFNSRGELPLWITPNTSYKFIEYDSSGGIIRVTDNVTTQQLLSLYGGVDTGAVNAYIIAYQAPYTAYQDGVSIYWIAANTNTGASTINVSFNGGLSYQGVKNIVNQDGSALTAGQILANQTNFIIYKGGQFLLSSVVGTSGIITAGGFNATGTAVPANGLFVQSAGVLGLSSSSVQRARVGTTGQWIIGAETSGASTFFVLGNPGTPTQYNFEYLKSINNYRPVATYEDSYVTSTATLTGCTTSPTTPIYLHRVGDIATIVIDGVTATSNTTAMTLTGAIPTAFQPTIKQTMFCLLKDAGVYKPGYMYVETLSQTITFGLADSSSSFTNNFTNSGTKGIDTGGGYITVSYALT